MCLNQAAACANINSLLLLKVKCDVWSTRTAHRRLKNNFRVNVGDALKRFHSYKLTVQAIVKYSFCLSVCMCVCDNDITAFFSLFFSKKIIWALLMRILHILIFVSPFLFYKTLPFHLLQCPFKLGLYRTVSTSSEWIFTESACICVCSRAVNSSVQNKSYHRQAHLFFV